jgi:hypothetical protein
MAALKTFSPCWNPNPEEEATLLLGVSVSRREADHSHHAEEIHITLKKKCEAAEKIRLRRN